MSSIKKLFDSTNKNLNYEDYKTEKEAFESVESMRNAEALQTEQHSFVPQVDYTDPRNFAFFGSAELYYSGSFEKISGYYPYDGSRAERNEFYNSLLEVDKYIFNNVYPRYNGFVNISSDSWGSRVGSLLDGYGMPSTLEYITFKGGPNTGSAGSSLVNQGPNPYSNAFNHGNVYAESGSMYNLEGLPVDYGSGTRLSNLHANFDDGVTVEFWLKTGSIAPTLTEKQVVFDMWNNVASSSADYGRITLFLDAGETNPFTFVVESGSNKNTSTLGPSAYDTFSNWKHYAISFQNSGSSFITRLYVNGQLNERLVQAPTPATTAITTTGGPLNNETFTLTDAAGLSVGFIFKHGSDSVPGVKDGDNFIIGTNTALGSAAAVGERIRDAINGSTAAITATEETGPLRITLTQDTGGPSGNTTVDMSGVTTVTAGNFTGGANRNVTELNSKNMMGRLGALLTASSGLGAPASLTGAGKLSGSIDEFRYWKAERSAKQIGENWFGQVGGGANTDVSNTTLGVYYKFNEGITGISSTDSIALDYAGRTSNAVWTGYSSTGRSTDSAIVLAGAAASEYKDPVVRTNNPNYTSVRSNLLSSGSYHDLNNNSQFVNYAPEWVLSLHEDTANTNLKIISHVVGAYFDKLYLLAGEMPKVRQLNYTSASAEPIPFAQHLPQSLGLYSPDIFIDSTILESLMNRDKDSFFEGNLKQTKDLIYQNLYNNLAHIFKAKGTQKAIRNVLRCFNLDDSLVRFRTYAKNTVYEIKNNLQQIVLEDSCLNFNKSANISAVVYQRISSSNAESQGYLSPSPSGQEKPYGFTVEADIAFPRFFNLQDSIERTFTDVSLFGAVGVTASSAANLAGTDTTFLASDAANFGVYAVRTEPKSKNVQFKLSSSIIPIPFPVLTSSVFSNVYADSQWNLSVRLRPKNYPLSYIVTGSTSDTYDVIFRGVNSYLGVVQNSFEISSSITAASGSNFIDTPKRMYVGAHRQNMTGAVLQYSDVQTSNLKVWTKYLDNQSLNQHVYDFDNSGISASHEHISGLPSSNNYFDLLNYNTLALEWNFDSVTGSDSSGNFYVQDYSSGSAQTRNNLGWLGGMVGYQHSGYGFGWPASSADPVVSKRINTFQVLSPEEAAGSDMIQILSEDDTLYEMIETVPDYVFTLEKGRSQAISNEMMNFLAGVGDFNNLIGEPVNRYRDRYKNMEVLREAFFRRVKSVTTVEKYLAYYKWFDAGLSQIIEQMLPASADFVPELYNVVESHVLERPKYESKFPTLEARSEDPSGRAPGASEWSYPGSLGGSPLPSSPRKTTEHITYWKKRAERTAPEITSGDATVDAQREIYRKTINSVPNLSSSATIINAGGSQYESDKYQKASFGKQYLMEIEAPHKTVIHGGVNFDPGKKIDFTYAALRPAGPVNRTGKRFIPENVLLSMVDELNKIPIDNDPPKHPAAKVKRTVRVQHGREYEQGIGYSNVKSSMAFPFNIVSASVQGGYNAEMARKLSGNINIVNIHNDTYGPEMEVPMQGPFTNYAVGGHQSRHIALNSGPTLDNYLTRPEAWKILLGSVVDDNGCRPNSGAIGMVGPDYPYPEANAVGALPYPMTGAQKAYLYRDFVAKRPVNIRNIRMRTGSTILGNYSQPYEVVMSVGAYSNPRHFVDNQPSLPSQVVQGPTTGATSVRTFLDLRRGTDSHFEFVSDYSIGYLTGTNNHSIIRGTFAAPGGMDTMTFGYQDLRAAEYSVYNSLNYRNLSVKGHSQPSNVSQSQVYGSKPVQARVYDIHAKDYGLRPLLSRHAGKFFRDSLFVSNPGASYTQLPSFQKNHRNNVTHLTPDSVTFHARYSGDVLNNAGGYQFIDSDANSGSALLLTGATALDPLRNAITSSGFSWTGWIKFEDSGPPTYEYVWNIGNYNSQALLKFTRLRSGAGNRFGLWLRTTNGVAVYSNLLYHTPILTSSLVGTWKHFAVTWNPPTNATLDTLTTEVATAGTLYIDGVSQSVEVTLPTSGRDSYVSASQINTKSNFKNFSFHDIKSDDFMVIGGNVSNTTYELSASIDEFTFWKKELNSAEISQIYNSGVPCDITSSALYAASASQIWDWIRFEPSGGASQININPANPGTYGIGNRVMGYFENKFIPIALSASKNYSAKISSVPAGCVRTLEKIDEVITYTSGALYDNAFVTHQIPRSTQQYAWISGNVISDNNIYGFTPADFFLSDSSGIREAYNMITSSDFGSLINNSGDRVYGVTEVQGSTLLKKQFYPNVLSRLNTNLLSHLTKSSNTVGLETNANVKFYVNTDFAAQPTTDYWRTLATASTLNSVLLSRGGAYGHPSWQQIRNADNPILVAERADNILSLRNTDGETITRYDMPPVSMRGRPIILNFDSRTPSGEVQNITLKTEFNNESIYFNTNELNDYFPISLNSFTTPFQQLAKLTRSPAYNVNWVIYSENLFPSQRNEFLARTRERTGYSNGFWRDARDDRSVAGSNSWRQTSSIRSINSSMFVLDSPYAFLTRSTPPLITNTGSLLTIRACYFVSGNAGELQNTYTTCFSMSAPPGTDAEKTRAGKFGIGALYARKHMLGSPKSVVGALSISTTASSTTWTNFMKTSSQIEIGAGESFWDAPRMAGIIEIQDGTSSFVSYPSEPWFDKYADFKEQLQLTARDYSIVPEFRISENLKDYLKGGVSNPGKTNDFEIVGTGIRSNSSSFYRDYSNSEFLQNFKAVKSETLLDASEIRLVCSAAIRFNPYNGFYPAQRSIQLVEQFVETYSPLFNVTLGSDASKGQPGSSNTIYGLNRMMAQAVTSPGILYNSIKAGVAVDYPIAGNTTRIFPQQVLTGASPLNTTVNCWGLVCPQKDLDTFPGAQGVDNTTWDTRIPFETIIYPEKYLQNLDITDLESHPSASLHVVGEKYNEEYKSSAITLQGAPVSDIYSRLSKNFFGAIPEFFLKDSQFTRLESDVLTDDLQFSPGDVYMARIKMFRSTTGSRDYTQEESAIAITGSMYPSNPAGVFAPGGGRPYFTYPSSSWGTGSIFYPLPQDPIRQQGNDSSGVKPFEETFTMYSRPSAYGPSVLGLATGSVSPGTASSGPVGPYGYATVFDSNTGHNPAFTPPYSDGEAWVDLIFRPTASVSYDLERVLAETKAIYRRFDPGPIITGSFYPSWTVTYRTPFIYDAVRANYIWFHEDAQQSLAPYSARIINKNSMQISASINLFGIERVQFVEKDKFGNEISDRNTTSGKKWVIQPKFETPMLNFNPDYGVRKLSLAPGGTTGTGSTDLSMPTYGSASVSYGMWHQFGEIPSDPNTGIFMQIEDISTDWLKYHYEVINQPSLYNNMETVAKDRQSTYKGVKSLSSLVGFDKKTPKKRLGELKDSVTVKEAIVAVPYIVTEGVQTSLGITPTSVSSKKFINIPKVRFDAALNNVVNTVQGDSLDLAGSSIREQLQKMQNYVMPPQFNFIDNTAIDPVVMYIFEFSYTFDRDDLSYIWQNLAPRDYKKISFQSDSVSHTLADNELMSANNLSESDNLRWMVFKVKQKSQADYFDYVKAQAGQASNDPFLRTPKTPEDEYLRPNWPYDYLSFVELIKMDGDILFRKGQNESTGSETTLPENTQIKTALGSVATPTVAAGNKTAALPTVSQTLSVKSKQVGSGVSTSTTTATIKSTTVDTSSPTINSANVIKKGSDY